jgi:hypothetical protein
MTLKPFTSTKGIANSPFSVRSDQPYDILMLSAKPESLRITNPRSSLLAWIVDFRPYRSPSGRAAQRRSVYELAITRSLTAIIGGADS